MWRIKSWFQQACHSYIRYKHQRKLSGLWWQWATRKKCSKQKLTPNLQKAYACERKSHCFSLLLGLSEVPCPPWLYSLAPLLQLLDYASLLLSLLLFTHSSYWRHVLSLGALLCISYSKALPTNVRSSFCRSDSNVSFLVRFLWLHI